MVVHSEHPFNGELPVHLLDDAVTPTARHFVRNNGGIPERARSKDLRGWELRVDGEVHRELSLTFEDLYCLPHVTMQMVLECAGNGRSLFEPQVGGTQWIRGAVACSEWTGVRLRDVLESAGVKDSAVYVALYGDDAAPEGGEPFSRGIPIAKALDEHTLIGFAINGAPLPAAHGFPARLLVPGWIGSSMQKWLTRIRLLDRVHDSATMSGYSYRVPSYPAAPGVAGRGHADRHRLDRQVAHHPAAGESRDPRRGRRAGRRARLGRREPGAAGAGLHRLRHHLAGGFPGRSREPVRLVRRHARTHRHPLGSAPDLMNDSDARWDGYRVPSYHRVPILVAA